MKLYLITIKNGKFAIGAAETREDAIKYAEEETTRKHRRMRVEYDGKTIWSNY